MWRLLLPLLILSATVLGETELEEDVYEYAEDDVEERAFLVIQKKFLESEVPDGSNMTLVLTVFNAGTRSVLSIHFVLNFTRGLFNRAAAKVVVKDAAWPKNVEILSDETTAVPVESLNPGLTFSIRTILRPLATGHLVLQPTTVTYAPTLEASEEQVVHSTLAEIMVLTTNEYLVSKILLMVRCTVTYLFTQCEGL